MTGVSESVAVRPKLDQKPNPLGVAAFVLLIGGGLAFAVYSVLHDTGAVGEPLAIGVFTLLAFALLIALGFEFVNGFHDTANAVATVIYTNSMPPLFAV